MATNTLVKIDGIVMDEDTVTKLQVPSATYQKSQLRVSSGGKARVIMLDNKGNEVSMPIDLLAIHAADTVAPLTDSTGGTVGSPLAAITAGASYAQADMVAVKNAIATLNAQINSVYAVLKDFGMGL